MQFSTQQIKMTYNFMEYADEATLQSVLTALTMRQLKKIYRTAEKSLRNRQSLSECRCIRCHLHGVNMEEGVDICDSCLAE